MTCVHSSFFTFRPISYVYPYIYSTKLSIYATLNQKIKDHKSSLGERAHVLKDVQKGLMKDGAVLIWSNSDWLSWCSDPLLWSLLLFVNSWLRSWVLAIVSPAYCVWFYSDFRTSINSLLCRWNSPWDGSGAMSLGIGQVDLAWVLDSANCIIHL